MKPLHILFNAWADRSSANAQNLNARDIAIRLDATMFSVSMFCQREPDKRLVGRRNIHLIRIPKRLGSFTMLHHMLRRYDAMFYLRFSRADSAYMWLRGKGFGSKPIITPIESPVNSLGNYPQYVRRYYDEVFQVSTLAVANSEYVRKTVRDHYRMEIPIVYSGVDVECFRNLAYKRLQREGILRVMFAGSLQERKHPELVLDAAVQWPKVEFIVMGDGPLKPMLTNRVRDERLLNVSLVSTKEYSEYAKVLATADIFFFPSRVEGLGKVLLEAAACGIPILVFDDYETPIVLHGLTGFKVRTTEEMFKGLGELIENRDLRLKMGAAAADHARVFDWNTVTKQWEQVFLDVVSRSI